MDALFKNAAVRNRDFRFDKAVSGVFDDMIERSVPLYSAVHQMICEIVNTYAGKKDSVYDLGCSTGNLCLLLADSLADKKLKIVGIDNSADMLKIAETKTAGRDNVTYWQQDITDDLAMPRCKIVILSLTLQFVRPEKRPALLRNIHRQMAPGGIVILFEKNVFKNPEYNRNFIEYYYRFKKGNRYSKKEIENKRIALENVLIPYTTEENVRLLAKAGFSEIQPFFQWFNFSAIMAKQ